MLRIQVRMVWAVLLSTSLLTLLMVSVGFAAAPRQATPPTQEDGQEYVVKAGDWLSKISQEFLGSPSDYPVIVEATNAKAETDPRFTRITDPNVLRVGQRLWIPSQSDQPAVEISPTVVMSDGIAAATVSDGEVVTPSVRFVAPESGAVVSPSFDAEMIAAGLIVEPAGEIHADAGHFHILVDAEFVAPGELVPFDDHHLHFGKGQLTTTLQLDPGVHVLRLQFANGAHLALEGEQYQDAITVTVAGGQAVVPSVRFVAPVDGATVPPRFDVEMAAEGLTVEPSGEIHKGAGHFHILVDTDFVAPGELVPFDDQHLHFGKGQLTTTLELAPGVHALRLQFANGAHIALDGEQYQDAITVTVGSGN